MTALPKPPPESAETVESAAVTLYAFTPKEFVVARNGLAASIRSEGDRAMAAQIARLPKPSATAWVVNALVRSDLDALKQIVDLGERYRDAERALDRDALERLNQERKARLAAVTKQALQLATESNVSFNAHATEELVQTFRAAIADQRAAAAVLSGRLVVGLRADGIDSVDVDAAVAGESPIGSESAHPRNERTAAKVDRATAAQAEARQKADREYTAAQNLFAEAEAARRSLEARAQDLEGARTGLKSEHARLMSSIREVERKLADLDGNDRDLSPAISEAIAAERSARSQADRAQRRVRALSTK